MMIAQQVSLIDYITIRWNSSLIIGEQGQYGDWWIWTSGKIGTDMIKSQVGQLIETMIAKGVVNMEQYVLYLVLKEIAKQLDSNFNYSFNDMDSNADNVCGIYIKGQSLLSIEHLVMGSIIT